MSEERILEIIRSLKSEKKKERMEAFEELENFMNQDSILRVLNENSLRKRGSVNWEILFIKVHNAIMTEVDKLKSKTFPTKNLDIMRTVIIMISRKSVYNKEPLISCNTMATNILSVFDEELRAMHFGSVYLDLLPMYILGHKNCWSEMKRDNWIRLKELCVTHCKNPPPKLHCVAFLDILFDIIRLSSKNVIICHEFLDLLQFVEGIYNDWQEVASVNFERSLLRLTNILCLNLAVEFRFKVCGFMESIFDYVCSKYERGKERNKFIYHFLFIYINVHNPNGVEGNDRTAFACYWIKWKRHIKEVFHLCSKEIENLGKVGFSKPDVEFLNLLVEFTNLIFSCGFDFSENISSIDEMEVSNSSSDSVNTRKRPSDYPTQVLSISTVSTTKKIRTVQLDQLTSILQDLQQPNSLFWLIFLESLLQKYPNALNKEYLLSLESLCKVISENRDLKNTQVASRCLTLLLKNEKNFFSESEVQSTSEVWYQIYESSIRSLHNDSCNDQHLLIRHLLCHSKVEDPSPLIKMYCEQKLQHNSNNFFTLLSMVQKCKVPEVITGVSEGKNVHLMLTDWLFQSEVIYSPKDLAKLLFILTLKRSEDTMFEFDEEMPSLMSCNDLCQSITRTYDVLHFKKVSLLDVSVMEKQCKEAKIDVVVCTKIFQNLSDLLENSENFSNEENLTHSEQLNILHNMLVKCELILYLLTYYTKFKVKIPENSLTEVIKEWLISSSTKGLNLLNSEPFSLPSFLTLYQGHYSETLHSMIRTKRATNMEFWKKLFDIYNIFDEKHKQISAQIKRRFSDEQVTITCSQRFLNFLKNSESKISLDGISEYEGFILQICDILCEFCHSPENVKLNHFQIVLAKHMIQVLNDKFIFFNFNKNFHTHLMFRTIHGLLKIRELTSGILNVLLRIIKWKNDTEIKLLVLQILKELNVVLLEEDHETRSKYLQLLEIFRKSASKKALGSKTVSRYVECLAEIIRVDVKGKRTHVENNDHLISIAEEIIGFLKYPCHEVKLNAAQFVGLLFYDSEGMESKKIKSQRLMFETMNKVLSEELSSCNTGDNLVDKYSEYVLAAISLLSWAEVVCSNYYWRYLALYKIIKLSRQKNVDKRQIEEIVVIVLKQLLVDQNIEYMSRNISFFLSKWFEDGYQVQEFPAYLFGCENVKDFYNKFHKIIIAIYWKLGKIGSIKTVAEALNKTTEEMIKPSIPLIISNIIISGEDNFEKLNELVNFNSESPLVMLDDIIFYVMKNFHDSEHLNKLCGKRLDVYVDESLGCLKKNQVIETFRNLKIGTHKTSLQKICLEAPSIIQKALMMLEVEVDMALTYEDKVFWFFKYVTFLEMIAMETEKGEEFREFNTFFIREFSYSLVSVIRQGKENLKTIAYGCLKNLGMSYLKEFSDIFAEFLQIITSALVALVKLSHKGAEDLLQFFICENYSKLDQVIALLDPFPMDDGFKEVRESRERNGNTRGFLEEIEYFVTAGKDTDSGYSVEGLKNLHTTLIKKKREFKLLYDGLQSIRGFSEDCRGSLLHQLISILVKLTSNENDTISEEASKCLGEIGPVELKTLALKADLEFHSQNQDTPLSRLLTTAIRTLSNLVVDDNLRVKKCASSALYALLSTFEGNKIHQEEKLVSKTLKYLKPFLTSQMQQLNLKMSPEKFMKNIQDTSLWFPKDHKSWITNLVKHFLECFLDNGSVVRTLIDLCEVSPLFCEQVFPIILDLILSLKVKKYASAISANINVFFEKYLKNMSSKGQPWNQNSVQCLIDLVDYIRVQRNYEGIYTLELNINYLNLARAALNCSAYFTAILYSDNWYYAKKKSEDPDFNFDKLCEKYPKEGLALTKILRESFSQLGIFDGIHGCGYMHLLDSNTEVQHYEHLQKWQLHLIHSDIKLSQNPNFSVEGLCNALQETGLLYTANSVIKGSGSSLKLSSIEYGCAARLRDWSILNSSNSVDSYEKNTYYALRACHNDDDVTFKNFSKKVRKNVTSELLMSNFESCKNLYFPLSKLECLKELEDFVLARITGSEDVSNLFEKWKLQDEMRLCEFKHLEAILSQRTIFIKDELEKTKETLMDLDLRSMLCHTYCKLIKASRKEKKIEVGIRNLHYLEDLKGLPLDITQKMKIEKARIFWEYGEKNIGKFLILHSLNKGDISGEYRAKALRLYGDWMAETKSENSHQIIEKYYLKSIEESSSTKIRVDGYASLAKFSDACYMQLKDYLSSSLVDIKQELISRQQDLASEIQQEPGWNQNRDKRIAYQVAFKQSAIDESEIRNLKSERDSLLNLAVKYYLLTLKEGEKYDLFIFRMISLWLSNAGNEDITRKVQEMLDSIPTYKFLCVLPQIVPRMGDVDFIASLVGKCCEHHPHHTLPLVLALAKSYEDLQYTNSKGVVDTPRVITAQGLLESLKMKAEMRKYVVQLDNFCDALIELANSTPSLENKSSGHVYNVSSKLKLSKIKCLESVAMPTVTIPYNKSGTYDIVSVQGFEKTYQLVGGVNLPKKIKCIGTDGSSRSLLIKGKDDLRQDAVMQQVFSIVNSLLLQNKETNERKLVMKTYKVVPLSQRSGIIEWCENTQPLSLYLVGSDGRSGAHKRFNPKDITAFECRERIKAFSVPHMSNKEKLSAFLEVCRKFQPAFHHFFIEKFASAVVSFERRLAYIRSVAVSSMIGYILGIGDRHVHNILIDNFSAEVIHIDLGIAFEQGKTLPSPEMVPFRLTRDIVDGMGPCGIEGVFRLSCVKTMEVLRSNQNTLLNVLEVLLYDPLYCWTITPEKACSLQSDNRGTGSASTERSSPDVEINKMAERALIRLKQKLQGIEDGVACNVEGQVNSLIPQARDPVNLSRMFHGWQAYL